MNNQEAKFILAAYRPGGQDASDPLFAEALEQVRRDPELATWFEAEQHFDAAMSEKLKGEPVPPELRSNVLAAGKIVRPSHWLRPRAWMAAAAAFLILLAAGSLWFSTRAQSNFTAYRDTMTDFLNNRFDHLDFKAKDVAQLQNWLAGQGAPADFVVPGGMRDLPSHGCRVLDWDGRKVSLVCYHLANRKEIHLFVIRDARFADGPPKGSFRFVSSGGWTTASWKQGNKTLLLAGKGDEAAIRKYL